MHGPGERDGAEDEQRLVARAVHGEERAFELLLELHGARVLRVLRLLGVPAQDREDLAQDVFIRVFRHLGGFRRGQPFAAWLYRITVNVAHDYRGHRARRAAETGWAPREGEEARAGGPGPAESFERVEGRRQLERALGEISERERAVFVLCEMEGLDTRAVARTLGITRVTVRRHLGRARNHLRALLQETAGGLVAGPSPALRPEKKSGRG